MCIKNNNSFSGRSLLHGVSWLAQNPPARVQFNQQLSVYFRRGQHLPEGKPIPRQSSLLSYNSQFIKQNYTEYCPVLEVSGRWFHWSFHYTYGSTSAFRLPACVVTRIINKAALLNPFCLLVRNNCACAFIVYHCTASSPSCFIITLFNYPHSTLCSKNFIILLINCPIQSLL